MLELKQTTQFKKDLKQIIKRGFPIEQLDGIITSLRQRKPLEQKHRDHALSGEFSGFRECHIRPDWLLVYWIDDDRLVLTAVRTGSHSDLF